MVASNPALATAFDGQVAGMVFDAHGQRFVHGDRRRRCAVASISKPLLAYAIMVALEEGTLDLDLAAGPFGSTVRHLLAHASGLGFEAHDPVTAPETRRIYSNEGFDLLGEVLERESGIPAADYLDAAVFRPLGMTDSSLNGSPAKDVISTAEDLGRFVVELMHPTLIAAATHAEFVRVHFPELAGLVPGIGSFRPNPWGLGVEVRGAKHPHWTGTNNSIDTYGHFGGNGSFIWVDPEVQLATVVVNEQRFGPWALRSWPVLSDCVLSEFA